MNEEVKAKEAKSAERESKKDIPVANPQGWVKEELRFDPEKETKDEYLKKMAPVTDIIFNHPHRMRMDERLRHFTRDDVRSYREYMLSLISEDVWDAVTWHAYKKGRSVVRSVNREHYLRTLELVGENLGRYNNPAYRRGEKDIRFMTFIKPYVKEAAKLCFADKESITRYEAKLRSKISKIMDEIATECGKDRDKVSAEEVKDRLSKKEKKQIEIEGIKSQMAKMKAPVVYGPAVEADYKPEKDPYAEVEKMGLEDYVRDLLCDLDPADKYVFTHYGLYGKDGAVTHLAEDPGFIEAVKQDERFTKRIEKYIGTIEKLKWDLAKHVICLALDNIRTILTDSDLFADDLEGVLGLLIENEE